MASIKKYFQKEVLKFYTDIELPTFEIIDSMETELTYVQFQKGNERFWFIINK